MANLKREVDPATTKLSYNDETANSIEKSSVRLNYEATVKRFKKMSISERQKRIIPLLEGWAAFAKPKVDNERPWDIVSFEMIIDSEIDNDGNEKERFICGFILNIPNSFYLEYQNGTDVESEDISIVPKNLIQKI